jgi:hypothetical protein
MATEAKTLKATYKKSAIGYKKDQKATIAALDSLLLRAVKHADGQYVDGRMTFHTSHVPQFESAPATIRFQARVDGDVIMLTTADEGGVATGSAQRVVPVQPQ